MSLDVGQILTFIEKGGVVAVLVLVIVVITWGGFTRKWVFGYQVEELRKDYAGRLEDKDKRIAELIKESNEWRHSTLHMMTTAREAVGVAKKSTDIAASLKAETSPLHIRDGVE